MGDTQMGDARRRDERRPATQGVTIGVDLGGTKILAARVEDGRVDATVKRSTPREGGPAAVLDAIVEVVGELGLRGVDAVGVGAAGLVPPGRGEVGPAPNLPGWEEPVPVASLLGDVLGRPVVVENDVNAATYAEHRLGGGVGARDLLGVWVGTGVGGGLVLGGQLRQGRGMAGEIGHVVVEPDGRPCGCGGRGHLEAYAGRRAMEEEARRRHEAGRTTELVALAGKNRMKSSVFAKALAADDAVAVDLLGEAVEALGLAIGAVVTVVDIGRVVIGGGMAERLGPQFIERVEWAARRAGLGNLPLEVRATELGDDAGPLGAALVALDALALG